MSHLRKLSLCMIIRDEEQRLARCLESVKQVVDEMVIVDTGSQDGTKAIALHYGAKVYDYVWDDHFANARNYGLERATGDWILWLDADEEVAPSEQHALRHVLGSEHGVLGSVRVVNYYGALPADFQRSHLMAQYRLFRRQQSLRFKNAIHEQLDVKTLDITTDTMIALPVTIYHYGYMDDTIQQKNKGERNLQLLRREQLQENYDPWIDYHIASELYRQEDFQASFDAVNTSLRRFLEQQTCPPSLLYKLKYTILTALGSYEGGWPGINLAIQLYPDYVDLHFFKGVILLKRKEYAQALETFHHCLELKEVNIVHLTTVGAGSFHAWYYIGLCYLKQGEVRRAEEAFRNTLELAPEHPFAREELDALAASNNPQRHVH